jgi:uncharacterized protein (DUF2132 family)
VCGRAAGPVQPLGYWRWRPGWRAIYGSIAPVNDDQLTTPPAQPRNPLHGLTLERILTDLVAYFDWPELGARIPVRCFTADPSIASSLKFLRKTPWAREKVEGLYLFMLREQRRTQGRGPA